jgi:hypothetical protein
VITVLTVMKKLLLHQVLNQKVVKLLEVQLQYQQLKN